jgi:hypothetical protein
VSDTFAEFRKGESRSGREPCRVAVLLGHLRETDLERYEKLREALETERQIIVGHKRWEISAELVSSTVGNWSMSGEYSVSPTAVSLHRRGVCSCP